MNKQLVDERKKLLLSVGNLLEGTMVFLGFVWLFILIAELVWGFVKTTRIHQPEHLDNFYN